MSTPPEAGGAGEPVAGDLLVIGTFGDEESASGAHAALLEAHSTQNLAIKASAVIRREDDGEVNIRETGDLGMGRAAAAGGLLGGLLGVIFRRPLAGAGLGALLGAGASKVVDAGISDARLQAIADGLPNGTSAVAAIVSAGSAYAATGLLQGRGATILSEPITAATTVHVPRTGNPQVDAWLESAEKAVTPYAEKAAGAVTSATENATRMAGEVSDQAKEAWRSAQGEMSSDE